MALPIAVCVSGRGSNLQALIDAVRIGRLDAEIVLVASSMEDAPALERARAAAIPTGVFKVSKGSREPAQAAMGHAILNAGARLVVLAGYDRILADAFWDAVDPIPVINIHPSLLPAFAGLNNMAVHEAVIASGARETGVTVHHARRGTLDEGETVLQRRVPVLPGDTAEALAARVLAVEHEAIVDAVASFAGPATLRGVGDPLAEKDRVADALAYMAREATAYLASLDARPVRTPRVDDALRRFGGPLPEDGTGAMPALEELVAGSDAALASAGPRFFHWVTGGGTPAALAADWFTSAIDQNAFAHDSSPIGTRLESVAVDWLKELFGMPASWGGVLTTGATTANFVGLACARRWWAQRHGVDVDDRGFAGLPAVPVISSGFIHVSATKALAMLGLGRGTVRRLSRDSVGTLDLDALESALRDLGGAPAILIGNAGEVNAGHFDPLARMADLAERYGAWLHVDGAFGLFAAVSPRTRHLTEGIERAHSVIGDAHKWLNVPYDSGFAFVRDASLMPGPFAVGAAYLPTDGVMFGVLGPEASRRARGLAVWATLRAYGRRGHREMVERHLDLAQRVARAVTAAPDLELLAGVPLNIVCFRAHPRGMDDEAALNELNARIGSAILRDGRVYVGTTRWAGKTAFRPAIVNWRTTEADVDLITDVVLDLVRREAQGLLSSAV
ncbi:MAG: phosphoribosylglycinamide formyltransferase [Chloroflexi bacterium]|nr:phosphoribosylglycinamide formyltransferase [Chloroflexota bacterium]